MELRGISSKYNKEVRKLYILSNETMRVSRTLTDKVLSSDLADPAKFYSQPGRYMLLLFKSENLIGMVGIREASDGEDGFSDMAEVQRLLIHPECRRQHLGHEIMQRVHKKVPELGYSNYTLSTISTNEVAIMFYNSLDFMKFSHTC